MVHEVKELLLKRVREDKVKNKEFFEHGTEIIEDIVNNTYGELYAYINFIDYHIDYTAKQFGTVDFLFL